jgi:hypothetical protein
MADHSYFENMTFFPALSAAKGEVAIGHYDNMYMPTGSAKQTSGCCRWPHCRGLPLGLSQWAVIERTSRMTMVATMLGSISSHGSSSMLSSYHSVTPLIPKPVKALSPSLS